MHPLVALQVLPLAADLASSTALVRPVTSMAAVVDGDGVPAVEAPPAAKGRFPLWMRRQVTGRRFWLKRWPRCLCWCCLSSRLLLKLFPHSAQALGLWEPVRGPILVTWLCWWCLRSLEQGKPLVQQAQVKGCSLKWLRAWTSSAARLRKLRPHSGHVESGFALVRPR